MPRSSSPFSFPFGRRHKATATANTTPPDARQKTDDVLTAETDHFRRLADRWWDPNGPFRPLHQLQPLRLRYVTEQWHRRAHANGRPTDIKNIKVLDVGCGGGLMAIALRQLGADVEAIDAETTTIGVAKAQQEKQGLTSGLRFTTATTQSLLADKKNHH
ncbi:MAG: bifunctional 2-polyprenyl-6-hydroxyphenol methylase/3-demethylubiquinol 3-O-methyltransferase UbiG, partial [Alphaproteobacteria bacterium]|nr:bifunctional 2-polyprenyl-6-hydroxyphenol methylase/3-demethylubiquinol 3-O-methyltransferase UbiG [Alphaproteobacteria bacterium]